MAVQRRAVRVIVVSCLVLLPAGLAAQTPLTGAIAGSARDTSGAILPGVTVEATSPALIEGNRVAITDGQGLYRVVDLRPGVYTITFTLPGFSVLRREGVEVTTGFTATVNAELRVGGVEETVTVSGAAPIVDTQNTVTQNVFSRDLLDQLPSSKTIRSYPALIPGATISAASMDVGGNQGEAVTQISIHGNRAADTVTMVDGMRIGNMLGVGGGNRSYSINAGAAQEITFQTGGISAEAETGGVQMNVVPREGSNTLSGYFFAAYSNGPMQSHNVTDDLRARGLQPQFKNKRIYDVNPAVGGRVKRDKLWFFASQRTWDVKVPRPTPADYWNKTDNTPSYTPDFDRPFFQRNPRRSNQLRLTWQATDKHKIVVSDDIQRNCNCPQLTANATPEALGYHRYRENFLTSAWTYPATNRLLFESAILYYRNRYGYDPTEGVEFWDAREIAILEQSTGYRHNSRATQTNTDGGYGEIRHNLVQSRASASYVTGSHAAKVGLHLQHGDRAHLSYMIGDRFYTVRNGVPNQVTIFASPAVNDNLFLNLGFYAQDQWTLRKLTLNLGARFDYLHGWNPAQTADAGLFVPARAYPETRNLPNFKDLSPRLGAAYDLRGDGRTALKVSLGRYVAAIGAQLAQQFHPANQQVNSASRTWNDANRNFDPDCNLTLPAANGECGPLSNIFFGQTRVVTQPADDILTGFGNRFYNWQASASVQHELRPGVSVNVAYFRTWYGNFSVTDNLAITPADFDPFCITAPVDPRLGGVSGNQVCGFYDLSPAKFGLVQELVTQSSHYGEQTEVYNGFDLTTTARFGVGGMLTGGLSTGQTVTDNCATRMDSPDQRFCRVTAPFMGQFQVKFSGTYPLPWDFQASATYQDLPGIPVSASLVVSNALIAPSLGRNLGACRGAAVCNANVTVELLEPNTVREDRIRQLDLRVSRSFRVGRTRVEGMFDAYNALNASPIVTLNARFGPAWLTPTRILAGRTLKVGTRITF